MRSLLIITISALALTGCVTENSYDGNDKPVVENKINNTGAARTRIALALEYLKTGNNSQAKYNLERAAAFSPDLPEVHYSLAYYYQQVGEDERADNAYQKAINIDPNDPNTRNNYGVFLCGIGKYDRATEQLLKAIEIPSYIRVAESYENLALCAIEFHDFDNAEKYFKSAINHSSMRASSLISLAALYYAKSDLHKTKQLLERLDNSGQVSSRALMLSYLVEQRMGHIEKAEKTAAILVQTYPNSNEATLIISQQPKRSEFEILREQYRQVQLEKLHPNNKTGEVVPAPQIRIIKKKKAPLTSTSAQKSQTTVENNNSEKVSDNLEVADSNVQVTTDKPQVIKERVITPSTPVDTESILAALTSTAVIATVDTDNSRGYANDISSLAPKSNVEKVLAVPSVDLASTQSKNHATTKKPEANIVANNTNPQDGVTIISFGEPSKNSAIAKQPQNTPAKSTQLTDDSSVDKKVVFYQPQKNATVFSQPNYNSQPEVRFQNQQRNPQSPLLNPQLPPLATPYHILQGGENLFSISVQYNVKLQKLLQWNGVKESDRLVSGTKIYLNDPNIYYEINAGDTLYSIASERRLLIDQLMRWNKLSPDIALKPGYRLLLVDPESYAL